MWHIVLLVLFKNSRGTARRARIMRIYFEGMRSFLVLSFLLPESPGEKHSEKYTNYYRLMGRYFRTFLRVNIGNNAGRLLSEIPRVLFDGKAFSFG
jgi:hypothetical protein